MTCDRERVERETVEPWSAADGVCGDCIPWNAPLRAHVPHGAPAMTYAGWLLWHLHVRLHQGLGGRL